MNYYELLEVEPDASMEEIKRSYKRLALIYHPDKIDEENCDGLTKTFHDIAEAYETLSDGEKRKEYDNQQRRRYNTSSIIPENYAFGIPRRNVSEPVDFGMSLFDFLFDIPLGPTSSACWSQIRPNSFIDARHFGRFRQTSIEDPFLSFSFFFTPSSLFEFPAVAPRSRFRSDLDEEFDLHPRRRRKRFF